MQRCLKAFFLFGLLFALAAPVAAGAPANSVTMRIGSPRAEVDGGFYELQAAPCIKDDVTLVPLRFIVEAFGAEVTWNIADKSITLRQGAKEFRFWPGKNEALIDGAARTMAGVPVVEDGVTLVPVRFLVENLAYEVNYQPAAKNILIKQLPPPNQPPVAEFEVSKDTVAQGETVVYTDTSFDPDGDELTQAKWTGNERAFFAPGEYEVTLQVKDRHGLWSEPRARVIKVTGEVKMDELTYNLSYPIPGRRMDMSGIPVLDMEVLNPVVMMNKEKIMVSNSPETVLRDGILYKDVLSGENRLYYHHLNGSGKTKTIYLVAVNQGKEPVKMTVRKWGTAGPGDPMGVGRLAAYNYLDFKYPNVPRSMELLPGEMAVLNENTGNTVKPNQTTHGIFGVSVEKDLLFAVLAVTSPGQLDNFEKKLPLLARDGLHIRGTYLRANRTVNVRLKKSQPARLIIADGEDDSFLYGKDDDVIYRNKGNYGLCYRINIQTAHRVGVLFSSRGGVFAGAGAWDGKAFNLPGEGILQAREGCVIGVVEPGPETVLEFIPPAGSYLPINLIFKPF